MRQLRTDRDFAFHLRIGFAGYFSESRSEGSNPMGKLMLLVCLLPVATDLFRPAGHG